ncbi:MAG: glycoside hydrolase family 88 protein [Paludibacter sp.]|nr:glycoside hydrolase family 88 protein [Paludibacter sp.]
MKKVADWQLDNLLYESGGGYGNMGLVRNDSWARAVCFMGILSTYKTTGDYKYLKETIDFAERNNWQLGPKPRHADDQTVGQVYLELYDMTEGKKDEREIESIKTNFSSMYENPQRGTTHGWDKDKNWSWSDALFMAPPAIAHLYKITKEEKYIDLLDMYYWDSYDLLCDKFESLFYRDERYIFSKNSKAKTQQGKKVFWLRGNAWVIGGLAGILSYLPKEHKSYPKYLDLYKKMAARFLELQQIDGLWRPSMLDPWQFPEKETSGSSFACYALAWGINKGILDPQQYKDPVKRAWLALTECVDEQGKLGWVQPVGHDPQHIKSTDTMEYGSGAFLLAARQIYIMSFLENVRKRHTEDSIF